MSKISDRCCFKPQVYDGLLYKYNETMESKHTKSKMPYPTLVINGLVTTLHQHSWDGNSGLIGVLLSMPQIALRGLVNWLKLKRWEAAELNFLSSLSVAQAHVHKELRDFPPPSSDLLKTATEGVKPKAKDALLSRRKKVETWFLRILLVSKVQEIV